MNKAYQIRRGLKNIGREVFLADGDWWSTPFYAVIQPMWKKYGKSNYENIKTEIGIIDSDYYQYYGPFDHNIEKLSNEAYLVADGIKYIFKRKRAIECGDNIQFFSGILKRVWEEEDDLS